MRSVILERLIFCVSYSIVTLPVISSTLTFEIPFNLDSACRKLSALKVVHVLHAVQSVFEALRITFSMFIGSPKTGSHMQEFKSIVIIPVFRTECAFRKSKDIQLTHAFKKLRISNAIENPFSFFPVLHQPNILQNPQMMRSGRLSQIKRNHDFTDTHLTR